MLGSIQVREKLKNIAFEPKNPHLAHFSHNTSFH